VCVCALKGKWPELSTPNLMHVYSMALTQHALTQRSKDQRPWSHGYENHHGHRGCCATAANVGLHVV